MAQVKPTTDITEPIPAIVRVGRPPLKNHMQDQNTKGHGIVPPMPEGLPVGVWTPQSEKVLAERYLMKNDAGEVIETPDQMCWRVAWDIACAEAGYGSSYEEVVSVAKDFYLMMSKHEFLPNSPTLMNAGKNNGLQYNGCFVIPIEDSIDGIFDGIKFTAIIHKSGGGTGFSFSRLRQAGARVGSTKGVASGPVSFMKIYDAATEQIKQGGSRRGANMGVLRVDHPDILEFIHCKETGGITNFNISVAVTDVFIKAYSDSTMYDLIDPKTKKPVGSMDARKIMDEITQGAWRTGDPGMIFLDRINAGPANPVPALGPIETTNPCVTGDTRVSTEIGLVRISDLVGVNNLRILTGNLWQVAQRIISTGEKQTYLLITREGYQLKLTGDHKVLTEKGWKQAQKLNPGDKILIGSQKGGFGKEGSLELGRVLGWLVGDGTMKATEAVLMFFGQEKKQLAPVFAQMVTQLTDGMQIINRSYPVGVGWIDSRDEARVGSTRLWKIAENYGITRENKLVVPEKVFLGREEMQRGFLQALFTADGHVAGTNEKGISVRLTSTSLDLLIDVQKLLLNFGIASKIYQFRRKEGKRFLPDGRGGRKEYSCKAYHDLVVAKDNLYRFVKEIGFLVDYKNAKLEDLLSNYKEGSYSEPFTARFLKLISQGVEKVYDLTEPVTHSFVADGLVVHNCGEQPLYPYDACNLGSIFLTYFVDKPASAGGYGEVNWEKLERITKLSVRFLDNVIERNPIPLDRIQDTVNQIRRIGLGIGGWADMLVELGIRYDSEEAIALAEKVMKFINEKGHEASQELAVERGAFPLWPESIYKDGKPIRNCTVTTIAPTGTIGHIAGTSQGVEPFFGIAFKHYVKTNAIERSLYYLNSLFEQAAVGQPWYTEEIKEKIAEQGTVEHIEEVPEELRKLFRTAHDIDPDWHVRTQAAFQKYTDNAVSKTINLPNDATTEDIKRAYIQAYETGCMGITVYRDGCKEVQVLNLGTKDKKIDEPKLKPRPVMVDGATYRIETPVGTAFITVNHDVERNPFEVFISVGKAGSEVAAMAEALGRLISTTLRFGNHLPAKKRAMEIVDQLAGIGGSEPVGFGKERVRSLPDAVAKAISMHFSLSSPDLPVKEVEEKENSNFKLATRFSETQILNSAKRDLCPSCGAAALVFEEGCSKCYACGFSKC